MVRDYNLAKLLLSKAETIDYPISCHAHSPFLQVEDYSLDQVIYHLDLLLHAGFLRGESHGNGQFHLIGLAWDGHEMLDWLRERHTTPEVNEQPEITQHPLAESDDAKAE